MKIIKIGKTKNKEKIKTCLNCKTKFSFTNDEVKSDFRDGDYVNCPNCGAFVNVS